MKTRNGRARNSARIGESILAKIPPPGDFARIQIDSCKNCAIHHRATMDTSIMNVQEYKDSRKDSPLTDL